MAKYRWGFETIENDNPIFTECFPLVEDGTSLDYAQQTNEVFYRAKLNGTITFRFDTFDYILNAGYNAVHIVVLQRYDETESDFVEVWRGKFTLTDCTINYDTHTIDVTPETIDRYTAVLDNLEKEYNLVKLKANMSPVNILIRPVVQVYKAGSSKISNFVGNNGWESEIEPTGIAEMELGLGFVELRDCIWFSLDYNTGPYVDKKTIYFVRFIVPDFYSDLTMPVDGRVYNIDGTYDEDNTLECRLYHPIQSPNKWEIDIYVSATQTTVLKLLYDRYECNDNYESYEKGAMVDNFVAFWDRIFGRILCQTDLQTITIGATTYTLLDINDADPIKNKNYNKILPFAPAYVEPSIDVSIEPTSWPQDSYGMYFIKPQNTPTVHYFAVGPDTWIDVAYWWYVQNSAAMVTINEQLTTQRQIRDCYDYRSVILKLLNKAGVNPQYIISFCLGGTNDYVGARTDLRITPRSNVISSYYDTPAQNAPITLAKVLNMLKIVYQCYWYIDSNGNFHIEHISYYDNGYSTTEDEPELLVDLEAELHTRTLNNKVYGQNQVKFDKQDMPEQYTFGWADSVTMPFIGYPINCLDKYVQQGNISEQNAADFDSDVDYVLSSPNDVSKDGFFLFALPAYGLGYSDTLKVENVTIKDELGESYEVTIQNADAAFVKIHETWWRYHLPCENINVNNEDTVALTTGSYKLQTLEFTDTAMADIIGNVDNCNKIIRTQQGDGHIKTLSINLNSLATKADLLFNFVGRWYYLRGTALGASITISVNGESVTIDVSNNVFKYRYNEPISALDFAGTDVVSVNFADCDNLNNLTSANEMFKNCAELLAVDFANKTFGAVTTANDMFAGCSELTTLICPPTASWKADLDFSDCPNLTLESLNDLINDFLYSYDSGTHTITPNSTMWNVLTAEQQTDIIARAAAKGWTIAIPAQYSISGTSGGNTVYVTINGVALEIDSTGGTWQYDYNTPITSISFENDADVVDIDFSNSDGLAGLTSLANTFKGCNGLTTIDFTNCDLTNVTNAADCFSGCGALYSVTIPSNTWKPDVDLSASNSLLYGEMLNFVDGLYTYTSGTHTITFNQTYWDTLTQAQQQTISDAAQLKGWTTNAVMVVYAIKGKSTAASETFTLQFIDDNTQVVASETITCVVDGNGEFEHQYNGKKIYSLDNIIKSNTTITEIEFTEELSECVSMMNAFRLASALVSVKFSNALNLNKITTTCNYANMNDCGLFSGCTSLTTISASFFAQNFDVMQYAAGMFIDCTSYTSPIAFSGNLPQVTDIRRMFANCGATSITFSNATFALVTNQAFGFLKASKATSVSLPSATFANLTQTATGGAPTEGIFGLCTTLQSVDISAATFANLTDSSSMFYNDSNLQTISWSNSLNFNSLVTTGGATSSYGMFQGCAKLTDAAISAFATQTFSSLQRMTYAFVNCNTLTTIDFSSATFSNLLRLPSTFSGCQHLQTIVWSNSLDLSKLQYANGAFYNCRALTSFSLPNNQTFAALINAANMFEGCTTLTTISLPSATFANLTDINRGFYGCNALTTIDFSNATFDKVTTTANAYVNCHNLATYTLTKVATAFSLTAVTGNISPKLQWSALTYTSMVNLANWVKDFTGYSAPTITFKASAWNALSAAEQNNIDTILSGKNWTRAIA